MEQAAAAAVVHFAAAAMVDSPHPSASYKILDTEKGLIKI